MFHLYFGAFDIVLYLGGTYFAMVVAKAICDQMDAAEAAQDVTTSSTTTLAPMQSLPSTLAAPVAKREDVSVRVSVN